MGIADAGADMTPHSTALTTKLIVRAFTGTSLILQEQTARYYLDRARRRTASLWSRRSTWLQDADGRANRLLTAARVPLVTAWRVGCRLRGAAEIQRTAENAPRWPDMNTPSTWPSS